ncbi:MAG: NADH-quinone oxidoreductase subunit M [Niabella sp.]
MIALLLILFPLLSGLVTFGLKKESGARTWSLLSAIITFIIAGLGVTVYSGVPSALSFKAEWLGLLGSSFALKADGMGMMLCMLTAISFPLIFISTWQTAYKKAHNFFGLMLLTQAGLMGVFLAVDALLFYFFWELALIPVYFLASQWGGKRRIAVTFKFFVYTFTGSLLMLVALLYIYSKTGFSFSMESFYSAALSSKEQTWLFWLMFVAFAIKMPVFPFHTWQPDTYEEAPTAVTMVLSGIMVKMGVLGLLRWLLPVLPMASYSWGDTVSSMAVIGIVYASLVAFQQNDLKRLVAYSSIAHLGLMCVAVFSEDKSSIQGTLIQMFSHGINILGMWIVIEIIERKFGTRKISDLGGIAQKAPTLAIMFFVIAFANIALPLTNAFVGEFLMLNGVLNSAITQYNIIFAVIAGLGVILGAVYTLRIAGKVFLGNTNQLTETGTDININEKVILGIIITIILIMGIYPQPVLQSLDAVSESILKNSDVLHLLKKQ